jgi:hypothetical protein
MLLDQMSVADGIETPGLDPRIELSLNPSVVALHQLERTTAANVGYVAKSSSEVGALGKEEADFYTRMEGDR